MSKEIIIAIAVGIVALIMLYNYFTLKQKEAKSKPALDELDIPAEFQAEYDRGMAPENYEDCTFYTLTHCVHCVRLEKFLAKQEIPFVKVLLDNFTGTARTNLLNKVKEKNPRGSFPTFVSPAGEVTVGFREWQVRELFMKYSTNPENKQIAEAATENTENENTEAKTSENTEK